MAEGKKGFIVNGEISLSNCQIDLLLRATCIMREHNFAIDYMTMDHYDYTKEEYEQAIDDLRNQILIKNYINKCQN